MTLWLSIAKLAQQSIGDLMPRVVSDTTLVKTAISSGLLNTFAQAGLLIDAMVDMAVVDTVLLGVVFVAMGVVIVVAGLTSRKLQELSALSQDRVAIAAAGRQACALGGQHDSTAFKGPALSTCSIASLGRQPPQRR